MVKKILVPVDGSSCSRKAIDFAVDTALKDGAEILLLHVVLPKAIPDEVLEYIESESAGENPAFVYSQMIGEKILSGAAKQVEERGAKKVESTTLQGDPAEEIIKFAGYRDVDMIVIGSRGLGRTAGFLLGSVSSKVCNGTDRTCVIARKDPLEEKRILIVDDEPDVLATLGELLWMCHVEKAASFGEARELLEREPFDMAILDIMGVDGFDLLKIANEKKVLPVMLTAHALSPGTTLRSYIEGAAFYVPKEEMGNITTYLKDVLEARAKGKHFWSRWLERFGSFYEQRFAKDWKKIAKKLG